MDERENLQAPIDLQNATSQETKRELCTVQKRDSRERYREDKGVDTISLEKSIRLVQGFFKDFGDNRQDKMIVKKRGSP